MKSAAIVLVGMCLALALAACSSESAGTGAPAAGASESGASGSVPKIVFHDTIDDPQAEYLTTLGESGGTAASGTVTLDLSLEETESGVFEGCGVMTRHLKIRGEDGVSDQTYVSRTGMLHTEAGQEGQLTLTGWLTEGREFPAVLSDAPFSVVIQKDGTLQQKGIPFLLQVEGDQASLSIHLHDHASFEFHGTMTSESAASPEHSADPDSLFYINSLWNGAFSGSESGDYTAILLASPAADGSGYSGRFSVQGTGDALADAEETVTFSLEPFDDAEYKAWGGTLTDRFAQMGLLRTSGGDYILLLDGDQLLLEAAGKEIYFGGALRSNSESAALENEADKTRQLLSSLCRQKGGTYDQFPDYSGLADLDPNDPDYQEKLTQISEEMQEVFQQDGAPAWYPEGLIPQVNYASEFGYGTMPPQEALCFPTYQTAYSEEEDFEDLIGPYQSALRGYDNYQEYINSDNLQALFLFTMGKYQFQVLLEQSSWKICDVSVAIY